MAAIVAGVMASPASAITCPTGSPIDTGSGTPDACDVRYTNTGSFSFVAPPAVTTVKALIVAGGGAGGSYVTAGGGGGGGQVARAINHSVSPGASYVVRVGSGGTGGLTNVAGGAGGDSEFDGVIATGGGGGIQNGGVASLYTWGGSPTSFAGGTYFFHNVFGGGWNSAGGGGAGTGQAGASGTANNSTGTGGDGGVGVSVATDFPGLSPARYGGGGGGASATSGCCFNSFGEGEDGGGNGMAQATLPTAGAANTGGGGGGSNALYNGGSGGSGLVVVRYIPLQPPDAPEISIATAGNGQATITVTEGTGPGDPPDSFDVTASPGGATCNIVVPATTCTVTGLTNGTAYTFTATATNVAGTSGPSATSTAVTPFDPTPAPTPAATPSNGGSSSNSSSDGKTTPKATPGTPATGKGTMRVPVSTTGAGTVVVLGNRTGGPGKGAVLMCTAKTRFTKAGTKTLICVPTTAAQALRRKGDVRVRLVLSFKPKGARASRTVVGAAVMPRITDPAGRVTG